MRPNSRMRCTVGPRASSAATRGESVCLGVLGTRKAVTTDRLASASVHEPAGGAVPRLLLPDTAGSGQRARPVGAPPPLAKEPKGPKGSAASAPTGYPLQGYLDYKKTSPP
ncbi:hypothetical protein T484DRAFT_1949002 [Baffinella frigidus]|nr:hypothetical protein T484DRAFT_1949002 [Cryptophyta sp. CCMP2293]